MEWLPGSGLLTFFVALVEKQSIPGPSLHFFETHMPELSVFDGSHFAGLEKSLE